MDSSRPRLFSCGYFPKSKPALDGLRGPDLLKTPATNHVAGRRERQQKRTQYALLPSLSEDVELVDGARSAA